jgi:hypothetical protein
MNRSRQGRLDVAKRKRSREGRLAIAKEEKE